MPEPNTLQVSVELSVDRFDERFSSKRVAAVELKDTVADDDTPVAVESELIALLDELLDQARARCGRQIARRERRLSEALAEESA